LRYNGSNYYRGICTRPDVDIDTFNWMVDIAGGDSETLTWSNLFINSNYRRYMSEVVPLFRNKDVVLIVNENAKIEYLPFTVKKDFRVGTNCFINNYDLIEELKHYISTNNTSNHLFLVSAASLSNLIIHELHTYNPNNTYFEIGSTLNPIIRMTGWSSSRSYLMEYWENVPGNYLNMTCIWN